ncbi:MAG: hypothetical protein AAGI07_13485 [Bacteroidota bacterium]
MLKNSFPLSIRILIGCLLLLFACVSDDEMAPEIEANSFKLLVFNPTTEIYDTITEAVPIPLVVPTSFVINAKFRDDVLLDRMEVTISPENAVASSPDTLYSIRPWSIGNEELILPVTGTATEIFKEIVVPNSAASGKYTLSMRLFDANDNSAEIQETNFEVINNNPLIILTQPVSDTIEVTTGETLFVEGSIIGNSALDTVNLQLGVGDDFKDTLYVLEDTIFPLDNAFLLDDSIGIGLRFLRCLATDVQGNVGSLQVTVQVNEQ